MKCPKCGYLGFERVERCRNCGYDFSLTASPSTPDLSIRSQPADDRLPDDLPLGPGGPTEEVRPPARSTSSDLPLFEGAVDDAPLITRASPPRTPLAVRRATPEVPRLRSEIPLPRTPSFDLEPDTEVPAPSSSAPARRAGFAAPSTVHADAGAAPAGVATRLAAFVVDVLVLLAVDAIVVYFTMKICGVEIGDLTLLPKVPLAAFLAVQNGGYLVAFTLGGQTLGKMLLGIRVVPADPDGRLDLGQSIVRTLVWALLAVPAGLGFVPALFSRDHRGLHDRCAGTRVVRTV